MPFGELVYTDGAGNEVGLSVKEAETGIGRINIDNEYNTTYTCYVDDCDENEIECIARSNDYKSDELIEYLKTVTHYEFDKYGRIASEFHNS
jgi:uncharacterized protein involved in tolerance to divalent cations